MGLLIAPDPPVRDDGLCACGCGKQRPVTLLSATKLKQAKRYCGDQLELDPFATSRCARRWHGHAIAGDEESQETVEKRAAAGREGKQHYMRTKAETAV